MAIIFYGSHFNKINYKEKMVREMSKQLFSNRYILKINSNRLKLNNWSLNISFDEAKNNEEIIALGDSQLLRFIRRLTNNNYSEEEIRDIKHEIRELKKEKNNKNNIDKIRKLYDKLNKILYIDSYVGIVFDTKSDFDRATSKKGFYINGRKYKRLLGTTGGVKQNTVMFCDETIYEELTNLLDNGRNKSVPMIPAKFEAYKALSASVSNIVTKPQGILVIKDGITHIKDNVIKVGSDGCGGFNVTYNFEYEADKEFTDGAGMITPQLAEKWAIDLGLTRYENNKLVADYIPSGFNTRYSFSKGMLFTFPFVEFAEEVAHEYFVEDAWGDMIDIRTVDIILTTNMLKLWSSYSNIDDYMSKCNKNGYDFNVTKVCPKVLEEKRNMNYQYLQSYEDMSDSDIEDLISETVDDIKGALGEDYIKQILFLKGIHLNDKSIMNEDYDYLKALLIDKRVANDSYIKTKVLGMIEKRIKDAKKGVIMVDGNYAIISGDLYALCESMFKMEVKGLLNYGEFYSKHWIDKGIDEVVAFRSPMTSHNNIRKLKLVNDERISKWYRYIKTAIIFNAWDTTTDALNGCDFDK